MHNDTTGKTATSDFLGPRYVNCDRQNHNLIHHKVKNDLEKQIQTFLEAGLDASKIIIDPGIGFGKTVDENIELMANLQILAQLPYPLLLGASRKSFIGYTTNTIVEQRLGGSIASLTLGILSGAKIIRVHDIFESVQAARLIDEIQKNRQV
jgi:dihydropteroate synthase